MEWIEQDFVGSAQIVFGDSVWYVWGLSKGGEGPLEDQIALL